jgi:hypothetical protein
MDVKHLTLTQTAQQDMKQITAAHPNATLANAQKGLAKQSNARNTMMKLIMQNTMLVTH